METYSYLNGTIAPTSSTAVGIEDLALLRGYGVFDYFKVIEGRPVFFDDHLNRFAQAAAAMHLPIPVSTDELKSIIRELIHHHPHPVLGVKMILTGGYSDDGFTPAQAPNFILTAKPFDFPVRPVRLVSHPYARLLPDIKTLSYIIPIQRFPRLAATKADDFLFHHHGAISEASRSNIFMVKQGKLVTPQTGILPGITRKYVIQASQTLLEVEERAIQLSELWSADEVFLTATNQRLLPVVQIDDTMYTHNEPGPITRQLQRLFLEQEEASRMAWT